MDIQLAKDTLMRLEKGLNNLVEGLRSFFPNSSTRASAYYYLRGLLSTVERKNSWQLAQEEGFATPYRFQHLLGRALWNADAVRDAHQDQVMESFGDSQGTLIVDETGFLKKGKHSAGVARQYSGTAGRIENCQIGVFLGWTNPQGHILVDRELYLPAEWIRDISQRELAHIPSDRSFYTKIELAQHMIARAWQRGFKPSWVVADEVYGHSYPFRKFLEDQDQPYVLAVPQNQSICYGLTKAPACIVIPKIKSWKKLSCGPGSKGERVYQWALFQINSLHLSYGRWLLVRQSLITQELAYYLVFAPQSTSLEEMVKAAGQRWKIEECFEVAKGEVGLDQYEVRSFPGWYRHMTFALLALALLSVTQSQLFPPSPLASSMEKFKKKRKLLPA